MCVHADDIQLMPFNQNLCIFVVAFTHNDTLVLPPRSSTAEYYAVRVYKGQRLGLGLGFGFDVACSFNVCSWRTFYVYDFGVTCGVVLRLNGEYIDFCRRVDDFRATVKCSHATKT